MFIQFTAFIYLTFRHAFSLTSQVCGFLLCLTADMMLHTTFLLCRKKSENELELTQLNFVHVTHMPGSLMFQNRPWSVYICICLVNKFAHVPFDNLVAKVHIFAVHVFKHPTLGPTCVQIGRQKPPCGPMFPCSNLFLHLGMGDGRKAAICKRSSVYRPVFFFLISLRFGLGTIMCTKCTCLNILDESDLI